MYIKYKGRINYVWLYMYRKIFIDFDNMQENTLKDKKKSIQILMDSNLESYI